MEKENNLGRLLAVLLLTMIMCFGLYGLPDEVLGYKIKKVDLLSDIREKPAAISLDSLKQRLAETDTLEVDSIAIRETVMQKRGVDSVALSLRDSLFRSMVSIEETEESGTRIEDYSPGHIGLRRFFATLNNRDRQNRPVRIGFLGDSFIEGDIMVADFRSLMQKEFGGRGVGFVPITSVTAGFRPTIENKADGWDTRSILNEPDHRYILSGTLFEPNQEKATVSMKNTNRFAELPQVSSVKLIYEQNVETEMTLVVNQGSDTLRRLLPPTDRISQNVWTGDLSEVKYTFTQNKGFRALGVALEDEIGVVVDNFSLRGNSGMILERLDIERCRELSEIRPYDLIVLQYGLNVVSEGMLDYGWYAQRMMKTVDHLQDCFPEADILLLSVTDRSHQVNGQFETMPEVIAMVHAQRRLARKAAIPFWNMFGAMGGEGSMVRYVENNWASKDYTHFSFRGGRELAKALMKALLLEKEFYDEAEKRVH